MPSIRGSITSVTLSVPLRLALENRSFAAFNSAASNAMGVGGGGAAAAGGGETAGAGEVCDCAVEASRQLEKMHRPIVAENRVAENRAAENRATFMTSLPGKDG